jgi:hypothetical protein
MTAECCQAYGGCHPGAPRGPGRAPGQWIAFRPHGAQRRRSATGGCSSTPGGPRLNGPGWPGAGGASWARQRSMGPGWKEQAGTRRVRHVRASPAPAGRLPPSRSPDRPRGSGRGSSDDRPGAHRRSGRSGSPTRRSHRTPWPPGSTRSTASTRPNGHDAAAQAPRVIPPRRGGSMGLAAVMSRWYGHGRGVASRRS